MKFKRIISALAITSTLVIGGFTLKQVNAPITVQAASTKQESQIFTKLLNKYRAKHHARKLRKAPRWLNKPANRRFNEFVHTFKKTGKLDRHFRPNGTTCFSAFGKNKLKITENEGYYFSSSKLSSKTVATHLFKQFMYHDAPNKWMHRNNLRNKKAKYLSVHFATVKRHGINYYLVMAHTGK